jgi:hypothetical protein
MDYQGSSTTRIDLEGLLVDERMEPKALPLSLLEEITDSFSQYLEIGTGGFAVVYRVRRPLLPRQQIVSAAAGYFFFLLPANNLSSKQIQVDIHDVK